MNEPKPESFGDLLREKIAELDADEAPPVFVPDDPIERLGLDARRCLQLAPPTPRAPQVGNGYADAVVPTPGALTLRHMNIVR